MRKRKLALHVTLHGDSQTLSYYVEYENEGGRWELWTEGESQPLSESLAACGELQELLMEVMAEQSSSTTGTK